MKANLRPSFTVALVPVALACLLGTGWMAGAATGSPATVADSAGGSEYRRGDTVADNAGGSEFRRGDTVADNAGGSELRRGDTVADNAGGSELRRGDSLAMLAGTYLA